MEKVYEFYIRTTPEQLWRAITDPEQRRKYTFGNHVESDYVVGSPVVMTNPGAPGVVLADGVILEVDPPHKLVQTYRACWSEEVKAEGTSTVTWQITTVADSCELLLTHGGLREEGNPEVYGGWPMILCGLKTWLETGQLLTTPGSLMYS